MRTRTKKTEYDETKNASCKVITIEYIYPLDYSGDAHDRSRWALRVLRGSGAAEILETKTIMNSFNEACDILNNRRKKEN